MGRKLWHAVAALGVAFAAAATAAADRGFSFAGAVAAPEELSYLRKVANFLWQSDETSYHHVWPPMEFGWRIVLGIFTGFFGAAFGSVGGLGGGGIFVPMLTLIIGFDPKSSTAISKFLRIFSGEFSIPPARALLTCCSSSTRPRAAAGGSQRASLPRLRAVAGGSEEPESKLAQASKSRWLRHCIY